MLVKVAPLLDLVPDWRALLDSGMDNKEIKILRRHERTGRPVGSEAFLRDVEGIVGRVLHRLKPGPKREKI